MKKVIGFTGAGGTGKTTLASAYCASNNYLMVPSVVRQASAKFGITSEADVVRMDPERRLDYQLILFNAFDENFNSHVQMLKESQYDGLIFDRTLADHLAYILYYCGHLVAPEVLDNLQRRVMMNFGVFDHLYYFRYPPKFEVVADAYRYIDPVKDTVVDSVIHREFHRFRDLFLEEGRGLCFRYMLDGDIIDRQAFLENAINFKKVEIPASKSEFPILSRI